MIIIILTVEYLSTFAILVEIKGRDWHDATSG